MRKSKFTEEQITYALRQVASGTPPADVCRQLGLSEATFYVWKKKYAHLGVSELRKLRSLEDENGRLKRLVEEAVRAGVRALIFTSTTSAFGRALVPPPGTPAAWITEDVAPVPKNIYGVTKVAAESLCELFHHRFGLPCVVLRTSRFFPEEDDRKDTRDAYADANVKLNELLYRRADIEDMDGAHLRAIERATAIGFGRYIISATTPFTPADLAALRLDAPSVVARYVPRYRDVYAARGWRMFPGIDRVYVNDRARRDLGWEPKYDFARVLDLVAAGGSGRSSLAEAVGSKGYHANPSPESPIRSSNGTRIPS